MSGNPEIGLFGVKLTIALRSCPQTDGTSDLGQRLFLCFPVSTQATETTGPSGFADGSQIALKILTELWRRR